MKICFVSAEVAPYAKVGGLADVAGSLPKQLAALGHDVWIVMPLYGMIDQAWRPKTVVERLPVHINGQWIELATVKEAKLDGVRVLFVGHERYFQSATTSEKIYTPGIDQYLFFSAAVMELPHALGWTPDVVHCNDWHTGFIPVLMRERYSSRFADTGAVFTIHNLAYQGEFGPEILDSLALPRSLFVPELLETWGAVNFLKAGCVYSDLVNTVSPTYAKEIQTPEFGCKLEGLMKHLAADNRLSGILNGLDTAVFDPATDPHLEANYSASDLAGKKRCREAFVSELGLPTVAGAPLVGAVTRLSHQKGLDLLIQAAPALFQLPVQLVIQGLGDPHLVTALRRLQNQFPNHLRFFEKFDEDLAHRIYSGADVFVMPSLFEPCGLGQMIAMRYATVPLVRRTGGLEDTVNDGTNGFTFTERTAAALLDAFKRCVGTYRTEQWSSMMQRVAEEDHGWPRSAEKYLNLYHRSQESERGAWRRLA